MSLLSDSEGRIGQPSRVAQGLLVSRPPFQRCQYILISVIVLPLGLTKDRAPGLHPFAGAAPAKDALELGREPGAGRVDLPGGEGDLRLMVGNFSPVGSDGVGAPQVARRRVSR